MFSSREDLRGFLPFIITVSLLVGAAYFAGIRIGLTGALLEITQRVLTTLVNSMGVVLAVNVILLLIASVLTALIGKITHRRII